METATVNLMWHPQAQFAGYLVAERLDLGEQFDIRLETTPLDFSVGPVRSVLSGASEFGVSSPAHIVESVPQDLNLLLVIQQDSPLVYPVRKDSGITQLSQLVEQKVGVWPGGEDLEFRWMLQRADVDPEAVQRVAQEDTVGPFIAGDTKCAQVTIYHELHQIEAAGLTRDALHLFIPSDFDASLIKDGLIAKRSLVQERPAFVQAVVNTVLSGWVWAFQNREEAVDICTESWPALSRAEQDRQLSDIRTLTFVGATLENGLGFPDPVHVARAANALADLGEGIDEAVLQGVVEDRFWTGAPKATKIRS
jgi:NitT/TauT family transport system substrate-binding protein